MHPLTLPEKQSAAADRAGITWRDHVDDSGSLAAGSAINDELPVVDGEVPLPDWSVFEEAALTDLTDELREHFRSIAVPEPLGVTSDAHVLTNPSGTTCPSR